jgi:hypothetical protein
MSNPRADPPSDEHLLRFVAGRDVECPGCGYNLRDLRTDRCPECGDQLELGLRLAEPRQGALIGGLVGLAAGAGLGGLLLVFGAITVLVMHRNPADLAEFLGINSLGFLAHGIVLLFWVRNWGRIRRLSPHRRRMLVILCWAMPLAFVVLFAIYLD